LDEGLYGFWGIINDADDLTDPKSKAEGISYKDVGKPFKFLSKDEKKMVEASVLASAVPARSQFPILVDFNAELVFVASTSVDEVGLVTALIADLGGEPFSLAWQFGGGNWPGKFLSLVNIKNKFESAMATRAEELSRFRPEEVEKLDDKMLESVVVNYFSLSELDTGLWAGLSAPCRISLYKPSDPVSVSNPSVAFSLMQEFGEAMIAAAPVTFQSLDTKFTKKGDEKQVRKDLFTITVDSNVNLMDAGAAMLRGFDIPPFKRSMKSAIKSRGGNMPICEFWKEWESGMKTAINTFVDNVIETLTLDRKHKYGLLPFVLDEQVND
jgi:hypothetical protein